VVEEVVLLFTEVPLQLVIISRVTGRAMPHSASV
jgi:hypothetical protein